jgi:hypothetical protein
VIRDGDTINIYESGAQYNVTRKHLVKAPDHALITSETSRKYKEQMAEKKREALVRGAGRALEMKQPGEWDMPTSLDVVEALGEAVMMKALNPDNPKQVDAARFILQESGMTETQTKPNADDQQFTDVNGAISEILNFLRYEFQPREIVDGKVTDANDTRNENGG